MVSAALAALLLVVTAGGPLFERPFVRAREVPGTLTTLDGRKVLVLDAREKTAFRRGHIPGAVRVDWTDHRRGWLREGRLPKDLDELAADLAALGVDRGRPVLVCGAAARGWGEEGRIAWMLRYLGHPDVAVLDGGCRAWGRAGRPLDRRLGPSPRGRFWARPEKDRRATLSEVKAAVRSPKEGPQLLDVRTAEEYRGATPFHSSRGGHLPGAASLSWKELLDPSTGRVKGKGAVRAALRARGLDLERPVIVYCTGGVRSAFAAEVLRASGVRAANYDGGFWEWSAIDDLPVER